MLKKCNFKTFSIKNVKNVSVYIYENKFSIKVCKAS